MSVSMSHSIVPGEFPTEPCNLGMTGIGNAPMDGRRGLTMTKLDKFFGFIAGILCLLLCILDEWRQKR
ncbi:hypothetical protein LCGC14_1460300 [marine sediment metagenome]|uniref:Uncharacterized protein n=1 Tax=marine sediment metagenome TaxID=412755 RepID=A0A0F9LVW2_9ZZZZ